MEAVVGEPETTFSTPALVPSTVKVTVPLGGVVPTVAGVMVAVTRTEAPAVGVDVDALSAVVVWILEMVMVTEDEVALRKLASPL